MKMQDQQTESADLEADKSNIESDKGTDKNINIV